jgi:hypothetical protein
MSPARPGIPRAPQPPGRVPLERGRAAGMLVGLLVFGLGFLLAAVVALTGAAGGPLYLGALGVGFSGVGVVAFFLNRGTVPLPEGPIWSRVGLGALAEALALPAIAVMAAVYGLIGLGVLGNVVVPMLRP